MKACSDLVHIIKKVTQGKQLDFQFQKVSAKFTGQSDQKGKFCSERQILLLSHQPLTTQLASGQEQGWKGTENLHQQRK